MSSKLKIVKPKKHLSQNWLIDKSTIDNFVDFSKIGPQDNVLEIGLGKGAITTPLIKRAKKVITIEIDNEIIQEFSNHPQNKLKIINQDFLQADLYSLIKKESITTVISALPYGITSPIIHKIVRDNTSPLKSAALITQKEFAIKLLGEKGKRSYFTNLIEKYAEIIKGEIIKNTCFYPQPAVDSMFFRLDILNYPKNKQEVIQWEKFLHHIFKNPRKKLNKVYSEELLRKVNVNPNLRPQNLNIKELNTLCHNYFS